jgi:hypothetical protein
MHLKNVRGKGGRKHRKPAGQRQRRGRTMKTIKDGAWPMATKSMSDDTVAGQSKDTGEKGGQDDLFGDLVNHAMSYPQKRSLN